jgi:peptide/nickel transport system substrate-binding protein
MRIGIGVPEGTVGTGAGVVVSLLTSEPWITNKPDGHQGERVVTKWDWDESGTTLRLTLRRDVYFHDGERLTPELAAQALRETAKNWRQDAFSFGSVKEIVPSGEDTVDIRLKERNAFVVSDLSGVVVVKPGKSRISTGPFQRVIPAGGDGDHAQDKDKRKEEEPQEFKLTAFPKYYRGLPGISSIDVVNYQTQRKAWTALMRGEVDMLHEVSREAAEFVEAESTVKAYSFPRPYYIPLVFNVRHPVLKNVEVRKAINEAMDKAALVRDGMSGRGTPADGPISPKHWSYSPPAQPFVFSPASARLRLDKAGLQTRPKGDGTVPARFSFTCLVFAGDSRFDRLAVLVQKQLADVGIEMKLLPLPQKELVPRLARGDFDAFLFEMAGRSLSWVYEFWRSHDGALVNSGYTSADAVLDRIRIARSEDEVRAAVAELERVMHEDPPAAFLAWQATSRAVSTKFDVAAEDDKDILNNLWQWRPAGAAK